MYRIFISYSSKSKPIIAKLAEDLGITGHEIWFDHQLTGGQSWWDQILDHIRQCDVFIFALTSEALDSHACKLEYTYAHKLGKPVLPVKMDGNVPISQLPDELQQIQFVDYTTQDTQAAFRLMNALNSAPMATSLPDPLPEPPPVPLSYVGRLREQIESLTSLSFDEQASIVFKLKERLQEGDSPDEARGLLERMRRREDIYAKIDREIEDVLQSSRQASARLFARLDRDRQSEPNADAPPAQGERKAVLSRSQAEMAPSTPSLTLTRGTIFVVGSGMIGGLISTYGIFSLAGLFFVACGILIHGIFTQRVLGGTLIVPGNGSLTRRLLGVVLSGGPLNGFALRRFNADTPWFVVVLIFAGWLGVLFISMALISESNNLIGLITGVLGASITLILYGRVRRRSSSH
ncbi:MAG: toll/interleukin-1 receptor domain-containing protein [Anaerolineae bacterium]|nr:toll/interleukin-1 receptor domain-containing protein [Anaerolineae bacterium]